MKRYRLNGVTFTEKQLESLMRLGALKIDGLTLKNTPASTSLAGTQTLHGPNAGGTSTTQGGLFADGRVRPERFSALPQPRSFVDQLDVVGSQVANEVVEILTGQQADQGNDATGFCGDPPMAGLLKVMRVTRTYGDWYMKTQLNAVPTMGQRLNYADTPAVILNAASASRLMPAELQTLDTDDPLAYELYKLATSFRRSAERVLWQGVAGQNATQGDGWFNEPEGFAAMVKTGYADSVTGQLAPAADSIVTNWNSADIGATVGGLSIVEAIHDLYYAATDRASQVGMQPEFAFVMRQELFRRLTDVYACSYALTRCGDGSAGSPVNRDGVAVQQLRAEMASGRYLLVDGVPVPVIVSEGLPLARLQVGVLRSDLFLMPLRDAGRPLTYLQYAQLDSAEALTYARFVSEKVAFLNGGMYVLGERSTGLCFEYLMAARMRPMLETPFLAGRIDNVHFSYTAATRVADPGVTYLYADGGRTYTNNV